MINIIVHTLIPGVSVLTTHTQGNSATQLIVIAKNLWSNQRVKERNTVNTGTNEPEHSVTNEIKLKNSLEFRTNNHDGIYNISHDGIYNSCSELKHSGSKSKHSGTLNETDTVLL